MREDEMTERELLERYSQPVDFVLVDDKRVEEYVREESVPVEVGE